MENEKVDISLTVAQWNAVLAVLGNAPFTQVVESIRLIQEQAMPQVAELQKKYPAPETEETAEAA